MAVHESGTERITNTVYNNCLTKAEWKFPVSFERSLLLVCRFYFWHTANRKLLSVIEMLSSNWAVASKTNCLIDKATINNVKWKSV